MNLLWDCKTCSFYFEHPGVLIDWTQSYTAPVILAGGVQVIGGVSSLVVTLRKRRPTE